MVNVIFDEHFQKQFSKIKNNYLKTRIKAQLAKIFQNPVVGKPMQNNRKGTRELYIKPFRLSYCYYKEKDTVEILNLYHKKKQ